MISQQFQIKAMSEYMNGNFPVAIDNCNKAIESDIVDKRLYYLIRGNAKAKLMMYKEAIEDYCEAIKIDSANGAAYSNRGVIKMKLEQYLAAIEDFNTIIKTHENFAVAYYNRATAKMELKKFKEAIEDYNKAIEVLEKNYGKAIEFDSDRALFYNGRGNAKYSIKNYEDAIKDYSIAIEKEPQFVAAYNNRGSAKFLLNKTAEADEDLKTALTLNPYKVKNYQWQGLLNHALPLFVHSINDYKSAINFNKENTNLLLLKILPLMNARKEDYEEIAKELVRYDDYFLQTTETDKKNRQFYETIYLQSIKIIALLQVNNIDIPVSHYTTIGAAESLLFDASPLRLSSLTDTNDECEGYLLFKILGIDTKFTSNNMNAFICCFVLGNDNPNMFRLYGKTNKVENSGICLTVSKDVFNQQLTLINSTTINNQKTATLFSCIYVHYNKNDSNKSIYVTNIGGGSEDKKIEVQTNLNILKTIVNDNRTLNQSIIADLLIHLRYLIKIDSWQEEKECRIIKLASSGSPTIIENPTNKKTHINYLPIDKFITNIHIGCNAFNDKDKQKTFIDKIRQKGLFIQCNLSRHKNRI